MTEQDSTYTEELYDIAEKTTLIITKPWSEIMDAEREMLGKMLKAARTSLGAARIIVQPKLDLNGINPRPARMIYFGDPVTGLAQYECITTDGTIVLAPHLDQLQNDPAGKQKLWVALKQLFGL
jgi:hypothetical protein